jgi:drug/metabolite transporter (DMT)-like permease
MYQFARKKTVLPNPMPSEDEMKTSTNSATTVSDGRLQSPAASKQYAWGLMAGILAAVCWGLGTVMSKAMLSNFEPRLLLTIQLTASSVFLWGVALTTQSFMGFSTHFVKCASLGILEPFLTYLLTLIGLTSTRSSDAVLIQSMETILIIVVSTVIFKKDLTKRLLFCASVATLGVILTLNSSLKSLSLNGAMGPILITLGTLAAAIYVVLMSQWVKGNNIFHLVALQQSIAWLLSMAILLLDKEDLQTKFLSVASTETWMIAVVSGLVQYALAFTLYASALKYLSANIAGLMLGLIPVTGMLGGHFFLGESIAFQQIIGALLVVSAIAFISLRKG